MFNIVVYSNSNANQMKQNIRYFAILIIISILLPTTLLAAIERVSISSPDGQLRMELFTCDTISGSDLYYQILANERLVVLPSKLNIVAKNRNGIDSWPVISHVKGITASPIMQIDTTWHPTYGEQSKYRDYYNTITVSIPHSPLKIIVRAYNEGIAFRYDISSEDMILRIESETTEFNLPANTDGWINLHPQDTYRREPIKKCALIEMPLTLELASSKGGDTVDGYIAIMEAHLSNYSRGRLRTVGADSLRIEIDSPVVTGSPWCSPWRVVLYGNQPRELLQNNFLVLNLSPEAQIPTDWIKPGKVIREITLNTKTAKECIDFAAAQNIQYIHFDAGWYGHEYIQAADATTVDVDPDRNPINDLNLLEVIKYGKSRGVGVILYVNRRQLEKNLDVILPLYRSWGVKGVKYGFINTGTHRWIEWANEAVRKAAENQLLVNIHDEFRPTGLSRTYPNLLTQEGICGNEEMPNANHNTALPFTRFLSGAADYTFCYYTRKEFGHEKRYVRNTPAHQLALPVVFYSPLQYLYWYDRPSDFANEPELAFWRAIPTVWDQTVVVDGVIGEFATIARRSGINWFVGITTNTNGRDVDTRLDFLEKNKRYQLIRYFDGDDSLPSRTKVGVEKRIVKGGEMMHSTLKASGGEAWHITPLD